MDWKWKKGNHVELNENLEVAFERKLKNTPRILTIVELCRPDRHCDAPYYLVDGPLAGFFITDTMIKGLAVVRGDRVLVWDEKKSDARPKIFLNETPGTLYPIQTVIEDEEAAFFNGEQFGANRWQHMAPIPPEPEPSEADIVAKLKIRIERLEIGLGNIATSKPALHFCKGVEELQKVARDRLETKS